MVEHPRRAPQEPSGGLYEGSWGLSQPSGYSCTRSVPSLTHQSTQSTPRWLRSLDATIERFNGFARAGVDADFRRGSGAAECAAGPTGAHGPAMLCGRAAAQRLKAESLRR